MRVLIAQVLFGKPDVLLLDEPTNHLDLDSIRWLENFLVNEFKGTLVVISHDRHFLNAVATHIADVDYQTITEYAGDYAEFVEQKYENKQRDDAKNAATKKKIGELQGFVQRFGAHASKSSQAQSRVKQIEKLKEEVSIARHQANQLDPARSCASSSRSRAVATCSASKKSQKTFKVDATQRRQRSRCRSCRARSVWL